MAKKADSTKILGPTYEKGAPEGMLRWRTKFQSREEMLKYLETGQRYWYADEGFGSEKRKKKA